MCEIGDWIMLFLLGICGWRDYREKQIPLTLLLAMSVAVALLAVFCPKESLGSQIGGAVLGILFFFVSSLTKQAIGYGDSWLILILGVHLGLALALQLLLLASFVAGVSSLFLLIKSRWNKRISIPFVPFMVLGYLGVMFL